MALPVRITARTYSPEEFEALPEFDDRYELIVFGQELYG